MIYYIADMHFGHTVSLIHIWAERRGHDRARGLCRRSQTGFVYGLVQSASFVRHSLLTLGRYHRCMLACNSMNSLVILIS